MYLKISYIYEDPVLFALINKYLNAASNINDSLLCNIEFQMELNEYRIPCGSKDMYIIIGESIPTGQNDWGEAIEGFISVIKNPLEKNIWHEVAHLFGANDHYNITTKDGTCSEQNCIMQYGKSEGVFCSETIIEINSYLDFLS